jgi:hypothetical protein
MGIMTEIRQTEELGGPVIQPDTVLPSQFFAVVRQKGFVEGEKRLMAAVLADAVDVYQKMAFNTESRGRQLYVDAEEWLFGASTGRSFFSFENICDVLSLEPEYIRRGLVEWKRSRVATFRPKDAFRREPQAHRPADSRRAEPLKKAVG